MTNVTDTINETYTNYQQMYIHTNNTDRFAGNDGWQDVDTLNFLRRMKLQQEIRFAEYWIPRQERRFVAQKGWVKHWYGRRNGDEISETNYQSSLAQARAEHHTVMFLTEQLESAQKAYAEQFEEEWSSHAGNVPETTGEAPTVSKEEKAELEALGIDV